MPRRPVPCFHIYSPSGRFTPGRVTARAAHSLRYDNIPHELPAAISQSDKGWRASPAPAQTGPCLLSFGSCSRWMFAPSRVLRCLNTVPPLSLARPTFLTNYPCSLYTISRVTVAICRVTATHLEDSDGVPASPSRLIHASRRGTISDKGHCGTRRHAVLHHRCLAL
jgi:hypothetical protein